MNCLLLFIARFVSSILVFCLFCCFVILLRWGPSFSLVIFIIIAFAICFLVFNVWTKRVEQSYVRKVQNYLDMNCDKKMLFFSRNYGCSIYFDNINRMILLIGATTTIVPIAFSEILSFELNRKKSKVIIYISTGDHPFIVFYCKNRDYQFVLREVKKLGFEYSEWVQPI